jgi:chromosome segregation ATPase
MSHVGGTYVVLMLAALVGGRAKSAELSAEAKAILEKRENLRRTIRDPLAAQIQKRREALAAEVDLKDLRFLVEKTEKAYESRMAADPDILAARKAKETAEKSLPEITAKQLAENSRLITIQREVSEIQAIRPQLVSQRQEVMRTLQGIRMEVANSPEVRQARQASENAERAFFDLPRTHPKFVAAQQAVNAAQQALAERIKNLPETKALEQAKEALADLRRSGPEITQARKARDEARAAYMAKLEEAIRTSEKGAAAQQQLDELEQKEIEIQAQQFGLNQELHEVRRSVEQSDPVIVEARRAGEEARRKYEQLVAQRAGQEQQALAEARRAFEERLRGKEQSDVVLQEMQDRLAKVDRQLAELQEQFQALRRGGKPAGKPPEHGRPPKQERRMKPKRAKSERAEGR